MEILEKYIEEFYEFYFSVGIPGDMSRSASKKIPTKKILKNL